ncbi:hypothetical protein BD408DRAFT_419032 [Parasitella parasitica]|nr:hypothetical protein BD408DRAFT_419032 [Parasitella parasitica]
MAGKACKCLSFQHLGPFENLKELVFFFFFQLTDLVSAFPFFLLRYCEGSTFILSSRSTLLPASVGQVTFRLMLFSVP